MSELHGKHWHQGDTAREQAESLVAIGEALRDDSKHRRDRCLAQLCIFEGKNLEDLTAWGYSRAGGDDDYDLRWPVVRSACESVQAKIAGRQKPKPEFLTSGGNYKQKRRAQRLNKFVEGVWHQSQGRYNNLWELTARVQLDAEIWHAGVVKTIADPVDKKVEYERVLPWRLLIDDAEAIDGNPRNMIHYYPYGKEELKARYCTKEHLKRLKKEGFEHLTMDELEALIDGANEVEPGDADTGEDVHKLMDIVWVWEGWRLPIGPDKPGKHMIAINGIPLDWEDWEDTTFPFSVLRWTDEAWGYWGTSLVDITASIQEEISHTLERLQESVNLNSQQIIQYEEGAQIPEYLESNETTVLIPRNPGTAPAVIDVPPPFHDKLFQYLMSQRDAVFEVSGASQMSATSRKEPGITSGVAIRNMNDIETERFSLQASLYEWLHVDIARETVKGMRRIAKDGANPVVKWPGMRFMREFSWSDVSLEEDQYHLRIFPTSSLPSTPAGRLATVEEMMMSGMISPDNARRLLGWADLEQFSKRENSQREFIDMLIERFLDAEDEGELEELGGFESPEPFMSLETAMVQFAQAYFEAKLERAPEFNVGLLRDWISAADAQMKAAEQAMQEMQAAAAGPPPGPGPAGPAGAPPPGAPPPSPGAMPPGAGPPMAPPPMA